MNRLAVECSGPVLSVALCTSDNKVFIRESLDSKKHSELINELVQQVMNEAGLSFKDLGLLLTTTGPGSFTGTRVAVNFIKTLSFVLKIPICAVSSLELIAFQNQDLSQGRPFLVWINAFKNMVYMLAVDSSGNTVAPPQAMAVSDLRQHNPSEKFLVFGDGWDAYSKYFSSEFYSQPENSSNNPHAKNLLIWNALDPKKKMPTIDWNSLLPLYIRESEAEEKRKGIILKPL